MKELSRYAQALEDMKILKEYIAKLEAERDYYQYSSTFAGVSNTPIPEILKQKE